uniref:Uncharacterized protein n=1 Tax=Anguilla anguilla TaxID=7936 RepID=A0A0E9XAA6_ANGAN
MCRLAWIRYCCCLKYTFSMPLISTNAIPPSMVRCRLDGTLRNIRRPARLAIVGKTRAPHRVRDTERWSLP